MKYIKYNITDSNGKSNCVIRTFTKMFNEKYDDVYNELIKITKELNASNFNDIEVFEKYMSKRNFYPLEDNKDIIIKDLKLDNKNYIIFAYDKKDFYHMFPIINNTIYDKNKDCFDLYTITIYKQQ